MRITVSLSAQVGQQLEKAVARLAEGSASLLADLALKRLLSLPEQELERLVARHRLDRKAGSRRGWTDAFWRVLSEEMGIVDRIGNPYTARDYGDYYAVLLLKQVDESDSDPEPFVLHVGPQMWTEENVRKQKRFRFERADSPVSAAEEVATWIREMQRSDAVPTT